MIASDTFAYQNPVSPYICSTPLDFIEERNYLNKIVFPQLNKLCKARGSYFKPIDIRWQPEEPKLEKGIFLKIQLDAIRMCCPYFIGLLGETYGPFKEEYDKPQEIEANNSSLINDLHWLDKNISLAAKGGHSWILDKDYQHCSLTELEMISGTEDYENRHVTLYYRTFDHLDDKLLSVDSTERSKIIQLFTSQSEKEKEKINRLRQRLVNKGVPVKYFRSCEELGSIVLEDWQRIIDIAVPTLRHKDSLLETKMYKEWLAQEYFKIKCLQTLVLNSDTEKMCQHLDQFAMTLDGKLDNPSILLIEGDRGTGKSTLIAHWLNKIKNVAADICIISHFVSASVHSSSIKYFMRRCTNILQSFYLNSAKFPNKVCEEIEMEEMNQNYNLCASFAAALALGPCVIVLDGLDELEAASDISVRLVKKCFWLPEKLPSTCKFVLTTTPSDISCYNLKQRANVKTIKVPKSFTEKEMSLKIIKQLVPQLSDLLGGEKKLNQLLNLKIMHTPLGVKYAACEASNYKVYSNFSLFCEECAEMSSLKTFWNASVQRMIQEFSWKLPKPAAEMMLLNQQFESQDWVSDALKLLTVSRSGLSVSQILSLLSLIGYKDEYEIKTFDWLQFRAATKATLLESGDGYLIFSHQCFKEIAEFSFFNIIPAIATGCESITNTVVTNCPYHTILAKYFSQQSIDIQVIEELPWQLMKSGNFSELQKILTDPRFLRRMIHYEYGFWEEDLKLYWSVCHQHGVSAGASYLQLAKSLFSLNDDMSVWLEEKNFDQQERDNQALICIDNSSKAPNNSSNVSSVASFCWSLARFLYSLGHTDDCKKLLRLLITHIKQLFHSRTELQILAGRCYFTLGRLYEILRDFNSAYANYVLFQDCLIEADKSDSELKYQCDIHYLKALFLCCQSNIHIVHFDLKTAKELLIEAQEWLKEDSTSFILKSTILYNLAVLSTTNQHYSQAESFLRDSVKLRQLWLGENHVLVANVLAFLAMLLSYPGNLKCNLQEANILLKKSLMIYERCFGPKHFTVSAVLNYLGLVMCESQDKQSVAEGQKYLLRSMDIRLTGSDKQLSVTPHRERLITTAPGEYDMQHTVFHDKPDKLKLPDLNKTEVCDDGSLRWIIPKSVIQRMPSGSKIGKMSAVKSQLLGRPSHSLIIPFPGLGKEDVLVRDVQSDKVLTSGDYVWNEYSKRYEKLSPKNKKQFITINLLQREETDNGEDDHKATTLDPSIHSEKKSVRIRSADGPRKLFQRFSSEHPHSLAKVNSLTGNHSNLSHERNLWSGRSHQTSFTSLSSSHSSHCYVPGSHAITVSNTQSICGPHSEIFSLLGHPPKPAHQQIHHRSAWYHVPGRYITPKESYPKKRMQKTENAKDIQAFLSLKAQRLKKKGHNLMQTVLE